MTDELAMWVFPDGAVKVEDMTREQAIRALRECAALLRQQQSQAEDDARHRRDGSWA